MEWAPYVSQAERRKKAHALIQKMQKKGSAMNPVTIQGLTIAKTFWGKAWCDSLALFADHGNRLPRGRTYVRNGSVLDLKVGKGVIEGQVYGSSLYQVRIHINPLEPKNWKNLQQKCSGHVHSILELLQGKISKSVMGFVVSKEHGLFPKAHEMKFDCTCYDGAQVCKHVAAVLYGVGARLDTAPDLLFKLRNVDCKDLITQTKVKVKAPTKTFKTEDVESLFGIQMDKD